MRVFLAIGWLCLAQPAWAGSHALVIGNADFANFPALPACSASAHLVAARLRHAGYDVRELANLGNGAMSGAIAGFEQQAGNDPALLYICTYGGGLGARDFLLPVSANLARPTDILTEGVLDRSVLPPAGGGPLLIALDLARDPAGAVPAVGGGLAHAALPPAVSVAVVVEASPPTAATEFAASLGDATGQPGLPVPSRITVHLPRPSVAGVFDAAPLPVTPPTTLSPAPASITSSLPADEAMSPAERSRVQTALAQLGYYDGKVDGIFGPDSRAAIRRWQHEQHAPMTGVLTASQATRLATSTK